MPSLKHLKAIVFDWAGTMIDHGSRAPAIVFQEIFRQRGIEITIDQAREPMGMAKREHILAITQMPDIQKKWVDKFGRLAADSDIDEMYKQFLPLQKETLKDHSQMIQGATKAAELCRNLGLKIGSSTGYTRELMADVSTIAKEQGYEPDLILCAEDAPRGRPAPYLLYEASKRLDVYPMSTIVKVDDTILGIQAGVNAGCWNVGITRTGNLLGLSSEEVEGLTESQRDHMISLVGEQMLNAGAHFIVESVEDIEIALTYFDELLDQGASPNDFTVCSYLINWSNTMSG